MLKRYKFYFLICFLIAAIFTSGRAFTMMSDLNTSETAKSSTRIKGDILLHDANDKAEGVRRCGTSTHGIFLTPLSTPLDTIRRLRSGPETNKISMLPADKATADQVLLLAGDSAADLLEAANLIKKSKTPGINNEYSIIVSLFAALDYPNLSEIVQAANLFNLHDIFNVQHLARILGPMSQEQRKSTVRRVYEAYSVNPEAFTFSWIIKALSIPMITPLTSIST